MSKNPNPQGKGGSPVLAALSRQRAGLARVPPKQISQVTTEMFTSLFVLESEFRFQPVPGMTYYLYRKPGRFWLSPTSPEILTPDVAGRFIGTCELQPDMTWTLDLAPDVAADPAFMDYLARKREAFEQHLAEAETMDDVLPVYERRYTFYRRASAFGLAYSLGRSMERAGIRGLSYSEALGQLTHDGGGAEG